MTDTVDVHGDNCACGDCERFRDNERAYGGQHYPECVAFRVYTVDQTGQRYGSCICSALRACEARVREDDQRILIKHGAEQFVRGEEIGKAMGYAAGVQAASNAVEALEPVVRGIGMKDDALAAIDALRGEA